MDLSFLLGGLENSAILVNTDNHNYTAALAGFLDPALKPFGPGTWVRCFRAVPGHWDTRMYFHPQCDGKKLTVTIIRVRLSIFGGFTDRPWHSGTAYSESIKSFLFSLHNTINGFQPLQFNLTGIKNHEAIYGNLGFGPTFGSGHDLYIANLASSSLGSHTRSYAYQVPPGCTFGGACTFFAGTYNSRTTDYEVFYYKQENIKGLETSTILNGRQNYITTLNSYLATAVPNSKTSDWIRCWHAAEDGWDTRYSFHPQCDGKRTTVTIIRVGQHVFGGFADKSWQSKLDVYKESSKSFMFSLYNNNGYQPIQLKLTGLNNVHALRQVPSWGPTFGSGYDIHISNLASTNVLSYTKPNTYESPPGCSTGLSCTFLAGSYTFKPSDIEVFYHDGDIRTFSELNLCSEITFNNSK
ncbi:hypothetical protein AC249_AIPGENE8822 [Exaiptasia diaphana]|nr:hypothetical protein AC249_AIPGENE8822 [Exaiptasia diaphana]